MKEITKNLFNPGNYENKINVALFLLRLSVGILMLTHGFGKLTSLFGSEPIRFGDPIGLGVTASLALATFSEFLCSILLIFGLGTRFAAVPLLITMLVAALIVHADDPFRRQELPLLYATIYMVILIVGAGKISIDNWIYNKKK
ncbi:DoxX family protein [Polaribacter uvawellassae]|uniref:DoxX family protein n=1 Tax=Polaribacter uvawellassae TaxID=3133495 RepID=UPI00321946EB